MIGFFVFYGVILFGLFVIIGRVINDCDVNNVVIKRVKKARVIDEYCFCSHHNAGFWVVDIN
jgi:hypothetical protein